MSSKLAPALVAIAASALITWRVLSGGSETIGVSPAEDEPAQEAHALASLEGSTPAARESVASEAASGRVEAPGHAQDSGQVGTAFDLAEGCLVLQQPADIEACLSTWSGPTPAAEEMAQWVCNTGYSIQQHFLVFRVFLKRIPVEDALQYMDEYQRSCTRYRESNFLYDVPHWAKDNAPEWYAGLLQQLTPELMFDPERGDGIVQMAESLMHNDEPWATYLLEAGGRGEFGGNGRQVFRAALIATIRHRGAARLDYVESLLASATPTGPSMTGSMIVQKLWHPNAQIEGSFERSGDVIMNLLLDPRFAKSAADTIVLRQSSTAPHGFEQAQWTAIWSLARTVADQS